MKTTAIDDTERKRVERAFHEDRQGQFIVDKLSPLDLEDIRQRLLQPCYAEGKDRYSDNLMAFHQLLKDRGGWANKGKLLDYGCGIGSFNR